ncbi:MAG: alpha/beta hydrolase [Bacteroidales bacterium]|nr:alpha/beta hydrolase [Bacteroidales bacterium]
MMNIFLRWFKFRWVKAAITFTILIVFSYAFVLPWLSHYLQSKFLSTAPNGVETPATYGIPFERVNILSNNRYLDSYVVNAPSKKQIPEALLIFHGAEETISNWAKCQKLLYDHNISSLVFDYSGFGNSTHDASIKNLNQDAIAAYSYFISKFKNSKVYVLGFSLGNAPMLASIESFKPAPSGMIIGSAFSSLKDLGKYSGKSTSYFKIFAKLIPDVWNNTKAIKVNHIPILVLHSDSDASNPLFMGQEIYALANEPKQFELLHGLKHNAPISDSSQTWWNPVIRFIEGNKNIMNPQDQ